MEHCTDALSQVCLLSKAIRDKDQLHGIYKISDANNEIPVSKEEKGIWIEMW